MRKAHNLEPLINALESIDYGDIFEKVPVWPRSGHFDKKSAFGWELAIACQLFKVLTYRSENELGVLINDDRYPFGACSGNIFS